MYVCLCWYYYNNIANIIMFNVNILICSYINISKKSMCDTFIFFSPTLKSIPEIKYSRVIEFT